MKKNFFIIVFTVLFVVVFLVYQATSSKASTVYFPSALLLETQSKIHRVRVGGRVTDENIDYKVEPEISLAFSIRDPGANAESKSLRVFYKGLKPDMFAPGRDVIIEGDYIDGTLIASNLLTQCPSKYEPPTAPETPK